MSGEVIVCHRCPSAGEPLTGQCPDCGHATLAHIGVTECPVCRLVELVTGGVGVKQITPKPGDVIAVEVDQYLTDDEALTLAEQVKAAFPGYPILIVERGRLAVLTREMAEAVNAASTAQNASAALARYAASRKTAEDLREARKSLGYSAEEIERMEAA